tara:strand:- start:2581 stop:3510 length:930 start_codon:yes stop_codon:yes gene_type:complete
MRKNFIIFLIVSFFYNISLSNSSNVFILITVDDEIITNIDILQEAEYLKALNPSLTNLKTNQIFEISKNSLIKEIIKKKEIKKNFDLNKKNLYLDEYLKEIYTKLNFDSEENFKKYLEQSTNYTLADVKRKLKIEIMWNELVYLRYSDQLNIDKKKLLKKINNISDKIIKEYQLSEIVVKRKKNENLDDLFKKINFSIQEIGFNNTANIYSISDSSKLGGKLGWINENNLSELISSKLKDINDGEYTKPILIGNDYLILKIEKIREKNISIDKEKELKKMIRFETNKQLNQFSKIFYDKSKINYTINEK